MVMRKLCYKVNMFAGVLVFLFGYAVFDGLFFNIAHTLNEKIFL